MFALLFQFRSEQQKILQVFIFFLYFTISIISLAHISQKHMLLNLPSAMLGWLWLLFLLAVFTYLAKNSWKVVLCVFSAFFLFGFIFGAYLEPPSDPLEHLRRAYSYCGLSSFDIPKENRGLWHYSLSGIFLCNSFLTQSPSAVLNTIDFLHAFYQSLLVTALFLVAKSAGLNDRWSFFATLTGFLFLGTSSFSYFSYYSLGASSSSMLIYWLWVAAFFFKRRNGSFISGTLFALLSLPILLVNHKQEAAFLVLVVGLWLALNGHELIWLRLKAIGWQKRQVLWKLLYIVVLFLIFFVLPRFMDFGSLIDELEYLDYNWRTNQYLTQELFPYYRVGEFIDYRIKDSLGAIGYLPILFAIPLLLFKSSSFSLSQRFRIILLSSLPLAVFFIPLLGFFWISSIHAATATSIYWRIIYSSFFWLIFAVVLFGVEQKLSNMYQRASVVNGGGKRKFFCQALPKKWLLNGWFLLSLISIVILGSVRSAPIYGKLDFMFIDSRSWWSEWRPMIEQVATTNKPVYTDDVTSIVLHSIFNYNTAHETLKAANHRPSGLEAERVDIKLMIEQDEYKCLVNSRGFEASWIPSETKHWSDMLSHTANHYQYEGGKVPEYSAIKQLDKCMVYQ